MIDDGSTDGTGEMLESLDTPGLRFHYRWQPNRGVAAARNVGLELARGEIIAFLDSDDLWLTDHLDVVVEVFGGSPRPCWSRPARSTFWPAASSRPMRR